GGATVGEPRTPSAAAFSNPAALTLFRDKEISASAALLLGHSSVDASSPAGYSSDRDSYGFGPEFGMAFDGPGKWHFGIASYGSVGSSFKSEADASVGVSSDFFSELSIANFALVAARHVTDKLSVGASVSALLGWTRARYTSDIPYYYSAVGPGVQAIVGTRYEVSDDLSLGLGVRLPGKLWAYGDMTKPDGHDQDVHLEVKMPAQIFVGANFDATRRLSIGLCGRWTDTSTFGESYFRFSDTPQGDVPLVPDANDEWRVAGGFEYAFTERITVGFSAGYADSIIGDEGVSPLMMDSQEVKVGGGISYAFDRFTLDFLAGHDFEGKRRIDAGEAVVFPGNYRISGQILAIGFRTAL
ncbi:MAG: outer membrane protein transport protein, partial [Deltaproteobacteria bacterium]|nr:outer membrane protein transport protein [Deltaproteobacteria bacterium]